MKFVICLTLGAAFMLGSAFFVREHHFNDQKIACIKAGGRGEMLRSRTGMPDGFECMRLHHVLKYRQGVYR